MLCGKGEIVRRRVRKASGRLGGWETGLFWGQREDKIARGIWDDKMNGGDMRRDMLHLFGMFHDDRCTNNYSASFILRLGSRMCRYD